MKIVRFACITIVGMFLNPFGVANAQVIDFDFADANAHQSGVDADGNIVDISDNQSTVNVPQWSAFVDTTGGFGGVSSVRAVVRQGGPARATLAGTVIEASVSSGFGRFADGDSDVFAEFEIPETIEIFITVTGDSTGIVNSELMPKFGYINFGQIIENELDGLIVECDGRTLLDYFNEGGDGRYTASGTITVVAFTYGIELAAISDRESFESSMSSVRIEFAPDQSDPSPGTCESTLGTQLNSHNEYETNIALSGDTLMVGDPSADLDGMVDSGAVYVYQLVGMDWTLQQTLPPFAPSAGALYGQNVELFNDIAVVTWSNTSGNAVNIFRNDGTQWVEDAFINIPDFEPAGFGNEIAIHRNGLGLYDVLVSEPYLGSGVVHVIHETKGHKWELRPSLNGSDGFGSDGFGEGMAVSEDTLIVGTPNERIPYPDLSGLNRSNGYLYVYAYESDTFEGWAKIGKISASDAGETGEFGSKISIDGDIMVVGSPFSMNNWTGGQGSAYIYRYDGNQWVEEQKLVSPDGNCTDEFVLFGSHVSVSGDTVLVSASGSGKTYAFRYDGLNWVEQSGLFQIAADSGDEVASHVSGDWAALLIDGIWNMHSIECSVPMCSADLNGDGSLNFFDVSAFLGAFGSSDTVADFTGDGMFNFFDVSAFLTAFSAGCS
jgi:FG-GAP repeat